MADNDEGKPLAAQLFEAAIQSPSQGQQVLAQLLLPRPGFDLTADIRADLTERKVIEISPDAKEALIRSAELTYAKPAEEKTKQAVEETKRAIKQAEEETKRAKEETFRAQEETKRAVEKTRQVEEETKQERLGAIRYGIAGTTTLVLGCITAYNHQAGAALAAMVGALCGTQVFVTYFSKKKAKPDNLPPSEK